MVTNNAINNTIGATDSGLTNTLTVQNLANTASSQATVLTSVGGTSAGDSWHQWNVGTTRSFSIGIDNSDTNDSLKFTTDSDGTVDPSSGTFLGAINPTTGGLEWGVNSNATSTSTNIVSVRKDHTDFTTIRVDNQGSGAAASGLSLGSTGDTFLMASLSSTYGGSISGFAYIHVIGSNGFLIQTDSGLVNFTQNAGTDLCAQIQRSGNSQTLRSINLDHEDLDEHAIVESTVFYTNGGDPFTSWTVSEAGTQFVLGMDNSATGDPLKLNYGSSPSTGTNLMTCLSSGEFTYPLQPAFSAYNSANDTGQTKGGYVTVDFDTELFDQGSDFSADTFTAPVTGRYHFDIGVAISSINAATRFEAVLVVAGTSARTYNLWRINPTATIATGSDTMGLSGSLLVPMTAGDTAIVQVVVDGGTPNYTIAGGSSPDTRFSGSLVC